MNTLVHRTHTAAILLGFANVLLLVSAGLSGLYSKPIAKVLITAAVLAFLLVLFSIP